MVTKESLIEKIAEVAEIKKSKAERVFDCIIDSITETLKSGEKVSLTNLGVLRAKLTKERKARNPKTGETITVPPKTRVFFHASSVLLDRLNK